MNKIQRAYIALHLRTWYLGPRPKNRASYVTLEQIARAGISINDISTNEKVQAYTEVMALIANPPKVYSR